MVPEFVHKGGYERYVAESLSERQSLDGDTVTLLDGRSTTERLSRIEHFYKGSPILFLRHWSYRWLRRPTRDSTFRSCAFPRRFILRKLTVISYFSVVLFIISVTLVSALFPSYTRLPPHYEHLAKRVSESLTPGRGNPRQEKVFIAASLFDPAGTLIAGPWADNVLQLIHLIGPENVYLSMYVNDAGFEAQHALAQLDQRTTCKHSLVLERNLKLDGLPVVKVANGTIMVKRITYLAEVRNKALQPLDTEEVMYDKVLYLNDVFFEPMDALQLLFSTNVNAQGVPDYRAACAVDFISPFKFYDTFATRDLGGWGMGVPFFPWFAYGGDSRSHSDVIRGKDAVRVRACWGGMVSFDARFLQRQASSNAVPATAADGGPENVIAPFRFRAERDLYWDASECCLIHADIQSPAGDPGIYMNLFIRCAYDARTLSWLWFTRRFERLYLPIHFMIDVLASLPRHNQRRAEEPWQQVQEEVWVPDESSLTGGTFKTSSRIANHAGFCGRRKLAVMKSHFIPGEPNYEFISIPNS